MHQTTGSCLSSTPSISCQLNCFIVRFTADFGVEIVHAKHGYPEARSTVMHWTQVRPHTRTHLYTRARTSAPRPARVARRCLRRPPGSATRPEVNSKYAFPNDCGGLQLMDARGVRAPRGKLLKPDTSSGRTCGEQGTLCLKDGWGGFEGGMFG